MALANQSTEAMRRDLERVAREYGPCDVVCAVIEAGTPDARIWELIHRCEELGQRWG